MSTLFSLYSPSSSSSLTSLSPFKTHLKPSLTTTKPRVHVRKPLSVHSSEPDRIPPAVRTFWEWLREEGVVSSKIPVKPALVPEGLGLVAQRDIAQNEVILQVPRRLWINPDAVSASEIGTLCTTNGLKPWVSVALFLIREKLRDDSPLKYYIDVLPKSTNSTIFWSEEELSEIQGTQLLITTLSVKEYVRTEFQKVEEIILQNRKLFPFSVTMEDFFWAFGMIRSRAFSRLRGQNLVMIPLVDLINHSSSITTEDHAHEVTGPAGLFSWDLLFSLQSPVSIEAGEQVFIQYNLKKSDADFALDYGFIEHNSDRNVYTLSLEIPDSDPFFQDKVEIAESCGLGKTAEFDVRFRHHFPPALIPYLRLVSLGGTDAFLLESNFRSSVWRHLELPISRSNEESVCRLARQACKSALSGYPTTIEEDEKLKEKGNLNSRLEMAVSVRAGEKKVLQQIDEVFKQKEMEMDMNGTEYYQERRLKELGFVGEEGERTLCHPKHGR